jgi:hypothetical protein
MTDITPTPTVPPPTPGDELVGKVINYVALVAVLALVIIATLLILDKEVPQIMETVVTVAVTGIVSLLAGRTGR